MQPGQNIRGYVLESRIGTGGVGEVWLAHHERLEKSVAIKLILPQLHRDEDIYNRFVREAIATASLDHPNIVSVYDFFSIDEKSYLVMSFIEGGSLQDRLKNQRPLGLNEALFISGGILDALDFAHQRGIVHRDVKPSNILLTPDNRPFLVDFGIALVLGETRVTKFGKNVGTPEYMSPEQIRGEPLDHYTDVYSFACVLYEMLAGRPPFGSLGNDASNAYSIMYRHINDAPPSLRKINPEVDEKIESAVMAALEKDRRDRISGCAQMSEALGITVRTPGGKAKVVKTTRKKSRVMAFSIGFPMLLVIIAASSWVVKNIEEKRFEDTYSRNNSLKLENASLIKRNEEMSLELQSFKQKEQMLDDYRRENIALKNENGRLSERIADLANQNSKASQDTGKISNLEKIKKDLSSQVNILQNRLTQMQSKLISISNIDLYNTQADFRRLGPANDRFRQERIRYLSFFMTLNNDTGIKGKLGVKYLGPDGRLMKNSDSPPGFTFYIDVATGKKVYKQGLGLSTGSIFSKGKHSIEFWWNGTRIDEKLFIVR